jgi:plasmid stabilization system protein ParE
LAELNWTQEAETWLEDIYDYIAADNPAAAVRTVNGIYEEAQLLRQHPEAGYKYETEPPRGIRILLYSHYLIKPMATSISLESFTVPWKSIDILCRNI